MAYISKINRKDDRSCMSNPF